MSVITRSDSSFTGRHTGSAPHLWHENGTFLDLYRPYITMKWRFQYFSYDSMKAKYKVLKDQDCPDLQTFETDFHKEIQRVDWFIVLVKGEIERDLKTIIDNFEKPASGNVSRTVELFLRNIFERCKECEKFYKLNHYVICKIAKKFEKLIDLNGIEQKSVEAGDSEYRAFIPWRDYPSNDLFNKQFSRRTDEIHLLTSKIVETYSDKFRRTYSSLAYGELVFVKNKERESGRTRFYLGVKLGLIVAMVCTLYHCMHILFVSLNM